MKNSEKQEKSTTKQDEAANDDLGEGASADVKETSEEDKAELSWHLGVCKWFNSTKGWGFINISKDDLESEEVAGDTPTGDIFVHQAVIEKEGFRSLGMGEEVEFQAMRSDKGWEAVRVRGVGGKEIMGTEKTEKRQKKIR